MPIYEYDCPECGRIEVSQRIVDEPYRECPVCLQNGKHNPVERLISATAFILKGTGWYKTDYSSGGPSASASPKKTETGAGAGSEPAATANSSGSEPVGSSGGKKGSKSDPGASTRSAL